MMNYYKLFRRYGMRVLALCAMLTAVPAAVAAQDPVVRVSGTVVDIKGAPLVGASVVVPGTATGATTGAKGEFSLNVSREAILSINYLGFRSVEIKAADIGAAPIVLQEDATRMGEIVVVGYGSQKKETLTGAIASITEKELNTTTHSNFAQSIQGKVAGIHIRQNSGEPGAFDTGINIRGYQTPPIYVIDGMLMPDGGTEFQRLNPADIESVSFLKDAAAAIYGRNGAGGAIIVTTKRGRKGEAKFNYNGAFGIQQPTGMPEMSNRAQWAQLYNEAQINANYITSGTLLPYYSKEELQREMTGASTDWYGLVYRDVSTQTQHNITASGGNDMMTYYVGLGYVRDNGLLKSGDINYQQFSFRANTIVRLNKNLRAEIFTTGRHDLQNSPVERQHNIFYGTRTALPGSPVYANDNPEYLAYQSYIHPLAISESDRSGYQQRKNKKFTGVMNLVYDAPFLKGLSFKATGSYGNNLISDKSLIKTYMLYTYNEGADNPYVGTKKGHPSKILNTNDDIETLNLQGAVNFSRTFADDHKVGASLVYEYDKYASRWMTLSRQYDFYTIDQVRYAGEDEQKNDGIENDMLTSSLIGRFNYSFREKYLLEFAFRYEGSYRYHPDIRWQFFPVVSAGWRITEEAFLKDVRWLSNLKLRASYGQAGADQGDPHQYVDGYVLGKGGGYAFTDGTWTSGISMPDLLNKKLTWMTSTTADIGIDVGLFGNRVALEFDLFQKDNTGIPATRDLSLPDTFGAKLPQENLNHVRYQGFDIMLSYNDNIGDFYFGIKGNFTFTRYKNIYIERGAFSNSYDEWRNGVNNRWGDFTWGYILEGQFQNKNEILYAPVQNGRNGNTLTLPGDYRYKDVNGDGVINNLDEVPLFYSSKPKLHYGITLSGTWKGIDFSMLWQGSGKYTLRFSEVYAEVLAFELNTPAYFFDRWHREDMYDLDSAWVPGKWPSTRSTTYAGANYLESEVWRKDASYIRLKNVEFGYTLPRKWFRSTGMESLRVYFTGQNLLTFCDPFVKPFDPEKSEGANNSGFTYPVMRSFNFGVNINF